MHGRGHASARALLSHAWKIDLAKTGIIGAVFLKHLSSR